ncbi:FACT complex subunit ssrp1 [Castilleja foliolosa]|uniref:FACT complex subunit SSRP1 n=1 Tax=Castilleja foliolosa TaxID=1961234 RepID=A0ABD3C302_9LAMI
MADGHSFNSISLGGRGGINPGQLKVHLGGIAWKKQGGGKAVEVGKSNLMALTWMKVPRSNQLGVRTKDGLNYKFTGFRDQDVASLNTFFQSNFGAAPEEKQLSISGKNWGEVDLNGNTLTFLVGGKQAFEVSLADVAQTQLQGKNDVMFEFHVDDTTGANEKDSLMEIGFHIPNSNTQFVGDENHPSAQVFRDKIVSMADVGTGGDEAVVTFDLIGILTPRGRYSIELHQSFLRLQGQANDFKIQYSSVVRVFWLPKSNQPHTFVIVTLDPPIRKGQTLYPHIVIQFDTDAVIDTTLSMSKDLYDTRYKDKLQPEHKGLIHEVFITILRGLSGAKVTKPGKFRSSQHGYAVKSSLKAEDGVLYPLEKSFFFLPKPPTLILHEEIDYVEFERHTAGGSNMHYFDLLIRLKSEQEHLFRNIQRSEYHNLFTFVSDKGLKILNFAGLQPPEGIAAVLQREDLDDNVDHNIERLRNQAVDEDSEDDSDYDGDGREDDEGSPTDGSGEEGSDASLSGGEEKETPAKKKSKKEPSTQKPSSSRKRTKDGEDDGPKKKKPKKKKDPNAPKKAMSAFMFFSQSQREDVKKTTPGISFTDMGKVLGERWNKLTPEEKAPYDAKARVDKKRYTEEMSGFNKNPQPVLVDSADESDNA